MKPFGIRTWKWLALRSIGRPSVPWFGLGGQIKSAGGGGPGTSPGAAGNGRAGGGTEISKLSYI